MKYTSPIRQYQEDTPGPRQMKAIEYQKDTGEVFKSREKDKKWQEDG